MDAVDGESRCRLVHLKRGRLASRALSGREATKCECCQDDTCCVSHYRELRDLIAIMWGREPYLRAYETGPRMLE